MQLLFCYNNKLMAIEIRRSTVETWGTIFGKCSQIIMLMMSLLWKEDYKMLKKYLHHWLKKQIRWD
jgi:hypothetical protein